MRGKKDNDKEKRITMKKMLIVKALIGVVVAIPIFMGLSAAVGVTEARADPYPPPGGIEEFVPMNSVDQPYPVFGEGEPADPETYPLWVYSWTVDELDIFWYGAPHGAYEYGCHVLFRDVLTEQIVLEADTYEWFRPDTDNMIFRFHYNFWGTYWRIIGDDQTYQTSACWAIFPTWSTSPILDHSVERDFRFLKYNYIPLVRR